MNIILYSPEEIDHEIADLERHVLEASRPASISLENLLGGHEFVRIAGVSNFWDNQRHVSFMQHVIDFATSAHGYQGFLTFVLAGTPAQLELYISVKDHQTASSLLKSAFPGILLEEKPPIGLDAAMRSRLKYSGMLSGIPSRKDRSSPESTVSEPGFYHLERIVRGMQQTSWIYIVQAYARPYEGLVAERQKLLAKIANLASQTRGQIQHSTQRSNRVSEMMGGEVINRQAEYAVELLERELERLETAQAMGRWQAAVYFGTEKQADAQRLASLLTGVLAGGDSRPDPLRYHFCVNGGVKPEKFHTYLTSEELALLIQPPREEAPGYTVSDLAIFDVDFKAPKSQSVALGAILWEGNELSSNYSIPVDELTRHAAVFGVTGSGKTTTLLNLLYQLRSHRPPFPFMVIEPAKTEYRALLGHIENNAASGPIPDLQVYTLGSDTLSPFRLNPFEFDLGDKPGNAPLLSHIDFLKAVFNAAFILYAPMPYVLETALHEIYEDKGWNLATEMNVRLGDEDWENRALYSIFPTLSDLYNKVEQVTARLGYESRIEQDVIAGLKARLGALRMGAKGLMLDTPRGIPMSTLLQKAVVLELENIGNDEEKTFLMGLLLARLYGYRRLQAAEGGLCEGLQHVLVIEEAHRLLKNVSTQVDTESSNLRAQAIETFVNMLSEVRHYGQGVIVADQIPAKLTPDVIKNTNLKVAHRLLAEDDRHLLGATMNMNDQQIRRLATLKPGEAAVYAEGDDHPLLIKATNFKAAHMLKAPSSAQLLAFVERYTSISGYLPTPDFATFGLRIARFGGPDPIIYQTAMKRLERWDNQHAWARLIARAVFARSMLPETIQNLRQRIASAPGQLPSNQYGEGVVMEVVLGAARSLEARGQENNWPFAPTEAMRLSLTNGLVKLARLNDLKASAADLDRFVRAYEASLKREWGPYPGCQFCRAICFYRSETRRLLTPIDLGHIQEILGSVKGEMERYEDLKNFLSAMVQQWLGDKRSESNNIGFCAALIAAPSIGLDEYEQSSLGRTLAKVLLA